VVIKKQGPDLSQPMGYLSLAIGGGQAKTGTQGMSEYHIRTGVQSDTVNACTHSVSKALHASNLISNIDLRFLQPLTLCFTVRLRRFYSMV